MLTMNHTFTLNIRCVNDFIEVIDNTGVYKVCGVRKYTFENKLCSSVIYIRYKAETLLNNLYRGFRLYYECEFVNFLNMLSRVAKLEFVSIRSISI